MSHEQVDRTIWTLYYAPASGHAEPHFSNPDRDRVELEMSKRERLWPEASGSFVIVNENNSTFGLGTHEETDDEVSSTVQTTWQTKLQMTTKDLPSGMYRIGWSYAWNRDKSVDDFEARIIMDDETVIMEHVEEPKTSLGSFLSTGSRQKHRQSGYAGLNIQGVHNFKLQWKSNGPGNSATKSSIWAVKLELWRVR